jgi:hypothetical protein
VWAWWVARGEWFRHGSSSFALCARPAFSVNDAAMRSTFIIGGLLIALITMPPFLRADDWVQVPNGGENSEDSDTSAPTTPAPGAARAPSSGDAEAIAQFVAHVKSSRGDTDKMCELIGMMANAAAVIRDQGTTRESQLETTTTNINRTADEKKIPREMLRPIVGIVNREIDYAYAHPSMSADTIKLHWASMCSAQNSTR